MKIRTTKLPANLDRRLTEAAGRRGVSGSAVVREALTAYLNGETAAPASFAHDASDLAGCVNGPSDLSTNPAHLAEYGRSRR